MIEEWTTVRVESQTWVALILDASSSAASVWPRIEQTASQIVEQLAHSVRLSVYFLGNPTAYNPSQLRSQLANWRQANARRLSVVGPILDQLAPETVAVVVGSGRVFDCDDYSKRDWLSRLIWLPCGQPMTNGTFPEGHLDLAQLHERLAGGVRSVWLGAAGAMPFAWDNPAYYWDGSRLIATAAQDYTVCVGWYRAPDAAITGECEMQSGEIKPLQPQVGAAFSPPGWHDLPDSQARVLLDSIRHGRYECPICYGEHPAGQFVCDDPDAPANSLVLSALAGFVGRGFVVIEQIGASRIKFQHVPSSHLPLPTRRHIAVRGPQRVQVFGYDATRGQWQVQPELWQPLHKIGDRKYALTL